ncbi:hypothetical protein MED222_05485 [Vibrio sp. MED222]|nr:hypothetical protein MED222_05485 [Vibrio sp. MED222]
MAREGHCSLLKRLCNGYGRSR